jgi:hypothetical protein
MTKIIVYSLDEKDESADIIDDEGNVVMRIYPGIPNYYTILAKSNIHIDIETVEKLEPRGMKGEKMPKPEPITIETTDKKAAAATLAITGWGYIVCINDLINPITQEKVDLDILADMAEIIEDINLAVGNEPSYTLRNAIVKLRKKKMPGKMDYIKMQIIAIEVANSNHGGFLKYMANAWLKAEPSNRAILEKAWAALIDKYDLDKEYSEEIKEHYQEYVTRKIH